MKPIWQPTKDKPRFCKHCGTALEPNMTVTGYNEFDGTPITPFVHTSVCPNKFCPRVTQQHWR